VSVTAAQLSSAKPKTRSRLPWPLLWSVVVFLVLFWGFHAHLERYITPQRGLGYALGITGGSMMILLLLYSARKRLRWLRWMGSIPAWFEVHMTLGVVGPILVLFHSNFSLGATNSNVALFCMLIVAGSGVVGRYIYTRLHAHLEGHEDTLDQLKAAGARMASQSTSVAFLPGLLEALDQIERRWIEPPRNPLLRVPHLLTGALRVAIARWRIRREIGLAMKRAQFRGTALIAAHSQRLAQVAEQYARRRLDAGRRIGEYKLYSRLFSLWHVLHLPLFFMLLIAGTVHVVAINIY
jgi:hypothetical protein